MRKLSLLTLLLVFQLSGCITQPLTYGNHIENPSRSNEKMIADDLVETLLDLYPPAKTQFDLQHKTPDFFGTYLIGVMRSKGYAILEYKSESKAPTAGALSLAYTLDQAKEDQAYRLALVISKQSLGRLYQHQNGAIYPVSHWSVLKE